jgi:hypothetical protein
VTRQASWYPQARKVCDEWTERVLAATDATEVDAMMAEILPPLRVRPGPSPECRP